MEKGHTRYLSIEQAASYAGVTKRTLHNYLKNGKLKRRLINGRLVFTSEELDEVFPHTL